MTGMATARGEETTVSRRDAIQEKKTYVSQYCGKNGQIENMFEKAFPAIVVLGAVGLNKALPNKVVREKLTKFMYRVGVVMTLGMARHPTVGPLWNKTVEPVVVDLIDNVAYAVTEGLVPGLRSDNGDKDSSRSSLLASDKTDASTQTIETLVPDNSEPVRKNRPWWRAKAD